MTDTNLLETWHGAWSEVDKTGDPGFYIRFLDATRAKMLRAAYANPERFYNYLNVKPGDRILDLGCGTGELLHPLAELVEPNGRIVGIDASEQMIVEAKRRASAAGAPIEFCVDDAHDLQFADESFDICTATSVFMHLNSPEKALSELIRVARPGGQVTITEADWETHVVDASNRSVTRRIMHHLCDCVRNGWIAHQLPAMFKAAGLTGIDISSFASHVTDISIIADGWLFESARRAEQDGIISADEARDWIEDVARRGREDLFFSACTTYRVTGHKPA